MDQPVSPEDEAAEAAKATRREDRARRAARREKLKTAARLHDEHKYAAALEHWTELRRQDPTLRKALVGALKSAQAAGKGDLVEDLLAEGSRLFPDVLDRLQKMAGRVPTALADEAAWQNLQAKAPKSADAEIKAATAPLREQRGRRGRGGQGRMAAILPRLESVVARYPGHERARLAHVGLLADLGRQRAAAAAAATYRGELEGTERLALAEAAALEGCGDDEAALATISRQAAIAATPRLQAASVHLLDRLGRTEDAEAACAAALAEAPDDIRLLDGYAGLAMRRGDWTEALDRWLIAEKHHPDSGRVKKGLEIVRQQLDQFEVPEPTGAQSEEARFFARFESLGGNLGGCEFGIVQSNYGSKSLGLLRFFNVPMDALLRGLQRRFEGVGLPENTSLRTARHTPGREEYLVRDNTYGFGGHTFIEPKDVPEDKMLMNSAKRLAFLRNKLIEEMGKGKKIFVFKFAVPVDDSVLLAAGAALAAIGPSQLLCAVKASADHPKGTVRRLSGNVLAGHFGHFMSAEADPGAPRGIDFAAWHDVCTKAAALCEAPA